MRLRGSSKNVRRSPSGINQAATHPLTRRKLPAIFISVLLALANSAAQKQQTTWSDYGGGSDNSHFVDLRKITKANVTKLKIAWTYETHDGLPYVFNPIIVDGLMYVLARDNSLVAIDASSGAEKWIHAALNGISRRGITYWQSPDRKDRRLIFTLHQQLQEIDAATGKSIVTFGASGYVDLRAGIARDPGNIHSIQSGTPGKVFENLIILGSSTGEGYMAPPGDLRAYDVRSGKLVWQFRTVPRPGDFGYDTWPKDAWQYIGGDNAWGEFSIDAKRGIVYFGLAAPKYEMYGADRAGDNLFSDCVLALDARTGKYLWHFQEVHHDIWDYDPTSAPQLISVQHEGKKVDAVAQAGKTGFLYVLDRMTGKPLWPIEERPVAKSDMPGEQSSPTQPFPTKPPPFARQKFSAQDVDPYLLTPEERARVQQQIAGARDVGMFTPPGTTDSIQMPGNRGGSNWGMTASDPQRGVVYVSSIDAPSILHLYTEEPASLGFGLVRTAGPPGGQVYQQNCQGCHGTNQEGGAGPSLVDVTKRLTAPAIRSIILNGRGEMPALSSLNDGQISSLISYLADPKNGGAATFDFSKLMPAARPNAGGDQGPVVAEGGAPAGKLDSGMKIPWSGPYGMMGGPPYPKGVHAPAVRYYTAWNVMYKYIDPPWSTLTSYDLNRGTIKWQIPIGEDPSALKHGAKATGSLEEQRGIIVTSTGLVFLAAGDGKVRAYDDATGKTLWSAQLPAGSRGIPAMYECNGRQYLVVSATWPIGSDDSSPDAKDKPETKTGYVAFSLP
jgi:quinoprotein glucose dehydrogenase